MVMIKTLVGAWCTSARFKEDTLHNCLFGCLDHKDDMRHYVFCPKLWAGLAVETNTNFVAPPLARLGLDPPSLAQMLLVHHAFVTYHDLKRSKILLLASGTVEDNILVVSASMRLAIRTSRWAVRSHVIKALNAIKSNEETDSEHESDIFF